MTTGTSRLASSESAEKRNSASLAKTPSGGRLWINVVGTSHESGEEWTVWSGWVRASGVFLDIRFEGGGGRK